MLIVAQCIYLDKMSCRVFETFDWFTWENNLLGTKIHLKSWHEKLYCLVIVCERLIVLFYKLPNKRSNHFLDPQIRGVGSRWEGAGSITSVKTIRRWTASKVTGHEYCGPPLIIPSHLPQLRTPGIGPYCCPDMIASQLNEWHICFKLHQIFIIQSEGVPPHWAIHCIGERSQLSVGIFLDGHCT